MVRNLLFLALASLLAASAARADGDLSDAEILALAGPKTCEFGEFPDQSPNEVSIPLINLEPGLTYEYCFRLPKVPRSSIGSFVNGLVFLKSVNLSNATCGTASVYVIRPDRKPLSWPKATTPRAYASVNAVQPGGVLVYTPGVWRVLIHGESGFEDDCTKYKITMNW